MKIANGKMRHRLTVMELVRTPDGGGGSARADTVKATIWARIATATPREIAAYGQLQQRVTHIATIRSRDDVEQGRTLVWLPRGADDPTPGSTDLPEGIILYVLTAIDADSDKRPGEFMAVACEQRPTI